MTHTYRTSEMTEDKVMEKLRGEIELLGSQKAFAAAQGFSDSYISDVLRGRRELGPAILAALGLERVVTYREKRGSVAEVGYGRESPC